MGGLQAVFAFDRLKPGLQTAITGLPPPRPSVQLAAPAPPQCQPPVGNTWEAAFPDSWIRARHRGRTSSHSCIRAGHRGRASSHSCTRYRHLGRSFHTLANAFGTPGLAGRCVPNRLGDRWMPHNSRPARSARDPFGAPSMPPPRREGRSSCTLETWTVRKAGVAWRLAPPNIREFLGRAAVPRRREGGQAAALPYRPCPVK